MIEIGTNLLVATISVAVFAGFMTGYTIAWWQRGRHLERALKEVAEPEMTTLVLGDVEARFRRSQR